MSRRNQVAVRAQIRSVTIHSEQQTAGLIGHASEPMTADLEFMGEHGPIRVTLLAATLPSWLHVRGEEWRAARFEVTLRRLRKAPRKRKTAK